ncbi:hypothetical protein GF376_02485 [Candidatus Peregrinibacteria bacterium]|nr:hypothetical protein [Candidatus Peregrinibacteria bacterium]
MKKLLKLLGLQKEKPLLAPSTLQYGVIYYRGHNGKTTSTVDVYGYFEPSKHIDKRDIIHRDQNVEVNKENIEKMVRMAQKGNLDALKILTGVKEGQELQAMINEFKSKIDTNLQASEESQLYFHEAA